jgi:hypothetical protein
MPNHCFNSLSFSKKDKTKVLKTLKGKNGLVDFNSLIPIPRPFIGSEKDWNLHPNPKNEITDSCGVPKSKGLYLSKVFGAGNWYDWACKNWGTKWNAYSISKEETKTGVTLFFNTAWSAPEPILWALASVLPEVGFTYSYEIEGGMGAGGCEFKGQVDIVPSP